MKKLNFLLILIINNCVYCMGAERKSLASFFGMPEYHQDISQQIAKYYALKNQWWYKEKDLKHQGQVKSAYFNKAGTEIITAAYLGSIRNDEFYIWDSNKGIEIAKKDISIPIEKALFNETATDIIVITKNEGYEALYHTRENENIKYIQKIRMGEHFFSCSKSGEEIISPYNYNKSIVIRNNQNGLTRVFNNIDQGNFVSAYFNEDETELIGMSPQGVAYIWNVESQKLLLKYKCPNFIGRSACFNHQSNQFLVYGASPILYVHAREYGQLLKELQHPKNIYYACFNNQDTEIFTVASDGYIRVWNCNAGCVVARFGPDYYETLDCHKEGNRIITPIGDCARMWVRYDNVTLPQILLIKLLNLWWRLKKPDKAINSSKKLLGSIATILRWDELYKIWQSLPKEIKDDVWLFTKDKIERYGK